MGKFDLAGGHSTKIMNNITGLFVIPPAQRLNLEAEGLQRGLGALDLYLLSAVRERERNVAVKEDFHWPGKNGRKWI